MTVENTIHTLKTYAFQAKNTNNDQLLCLVKSTDRIYLDTIDRKCISCWNWFLSLFGWGKLAGKTLSLKKITEHVMSEYGKLERKEDWAKEESIRACCFSLFERAVTKQWIAQNPMQDFAERDRKDAERYSERGKGISNKSDQEGGELFRSNETSKLEPKDGLEDLESRCIADPKIEPLKEILSYGFTDPFQQIGRHLLGFILEFEENHYGINNSYYYGNRYRDFINLARTCKAFRDLVGHFFHLRRFDFSLFNQTEFGYFRRYDLFPINFEEGLEENLLAVCPGGYEEGQTLNMRVALPNLDFFKKIINFIRIRKKGCLHESLIASWDTFCPLYQKTKNYKTQIEDGQFESSNLGFDPLQRYVQEPAYAMEIDLNLLFDAIQKPSIAREIFDIRQAILSHPAQYEGNVYVYRQFSPLELLPLAIARFTYLPGFLTGYTGLLNLEEPDCPFKRWKESDAAHSSDNSWVKPNYTNLSNPEKQNQKASLFNVVFEIQVKESDPLTVATHSIPSQEGVKQCLFSCYSQFEYVGHRYDEAKDLFIVSLQSATIESRPIPLPEHYFIWWESRGKKARSKNTMTQQLWEGYKEIYRSYIRSITFHVLPSTYDRGHQDDPSEDLISRWLDCSRENFKEMPRSLRSLFAMREINENHKTQINECFLERTSQLFERKDVCEYASFYRDCLYFREIIDLDVVVRLINLLQEIQLLGDRDWVDQLIALLAVDPENFTPLTGIDQKISNFGDIEARIGGIVEVKKSRLEIDTQIEQELTKIAKSKDAFDRAIKDLGKVSTTEEAIEYTKHISLMLDLVWSLRRDEEGRKKASDALLKVQNTRNLIGSFDAYARFYFHMSDVRCLVDPQLTVDFLTVLEGSALSNKDELELLLLADPQIFQDHKQLCRRILNRFNKKPEATDDRSNSIIENAKQLCRYVLNRFNNKLENIDCENKPTIEDVKQLLSVETETAISQRIKELLMPYAGEHHQKSGPIKALEMLLKIPMTKENCIQMVKYARKICDQLYSGTQELKIEPTEINRLLLKLADKLMWQASLDGYAYLYQACLKIKNILDPQLTCNLLSLLIKYDHGENQQAAEDQLTLIALLLHSHTRVIGPDFEKRCYQKFPELAEKIQSLGKMEEEERDMVIDTLLAKVIYGIKFFTFCPIFLKIETHTLSCFSTCFRPSFLARSALSSLALEGI